MFDSHLPLVEFMHPEVRATAKRVAVCLWGQPRILVLENAVERFVVLALNRTGSRGVAVDLFVNLARVDRDSPSCAWMPCEDQLAFWGRRFSAAAAKLQNVRLRALVVEDDAVLRELWPIYAPGLFHFIRKADQRSCDPQRPGQVTRNTKGIVKTSHCRPESALLLFFGLKRLWPELVHAEQEDGQLFDLVYTARADLVWFYPLASLPSLFNQFPPGDCRASPCIIYNGDQTNVLVRPVARAILNILDIFATLEGAAFLKDFVRAARPEPMWGPQNEPWITDELVKHVADFLEVRISGHLAMFAFSVARLREGGGMEFPPCSHLLPTDLYEFCLYAAPLDPFWTWRRETRGGTRAFPFRVEGLNEAVLAEAKVTLRC